jgi:hypothetical protein
MWTWAENINPKLVVTALPVVLCNAVAVISQYSFFHSHLPRWGNVGAVLFAAALESIAVFLAYMAHQALLSNDASLRLRLGSYAVGLAIGAINYSHFAVNLRPTVEAVSVGILSAASAPLWGIYSRRVSRDALMERGAIEDHAVRLGSARWTFHPVKSLKVLSAAVWSFPDATPTEAIETWEQSREVNPVKRARHAGNDSELGPLCKGGCGERLPARSNRDYKRGHANGCPDKIDRELADMRPLESANGTRPKSSW